MSETAEEIFTRIYTERLWGRRGDGKGGSGSGSTKQNSQPYLDFLREFLRIHSIKSVVDVGCGDWELSRHISWGSIEYYGYDVVKGVIEDNMRKYASANIHFIHADGVNSDLKKADLLICKDVLQHLPNAEVMAFLRKIGGFKFCLIANDVEARGKNGVNEDIGTGGYRCLDLTAPPFNLKATKIMTYNITSEIEQWTKLVLFVDNSVDSEIDVEELTKRIKDHVERMRRAEDFKPLEHELSSDRAGEMTKAQEFISTPERVSVAAEDLANEAAVLSPRNLGTGKRIIAPLVMRLHRLADTEVRWLMEPTIMRQTKFNLQLVNLFRKMESDLLPAFRDLERFEGEIQNTRSRVSEIENTLKNSTIDRRVSEIEGTLKNSTIDRRVSEIEGTLKNSTIDRRVSEIEGKISNLEAGVARKRRDLFINYPVNVVDEKLVVNERIVESPFVFSNLPQGAKRILDVGCAESYLAIQLATLSFSVYGIDVRDYPLSHPNFHFVRDDIANTSFPDEYFDVVLAISSIEHVGLGHYRDPLYGQGDLRAMKEIYRVLAKGGTLILSVPIGSTATKTWEKVYDEKSLKELLADFTIEKITYWIKKDEQWVSATLEDVKKQKIDIKALGDPYPLWPSIAALVAKKTGQPPS